MSKSKAAQFGQVPTSFGDGKNTEARGEWLVRGACQTDEETEAPSAKEEMSRTIEIGNGDALWSAVDHLEEGAKKVMLEMRANCMPKVDALLAAGWRFELPEIVNRKMGEPEHMSTEPWQWYWRRPPRCKGGKGMKFWSTTMAFNALKRESQG